MEEPQGISHLVDQSLVSQLQEMGFSKAVSEKSIFMTQCKDLDPAIQWISEHQNDPDFEEALQIVDNPSQKSNLTPEEAQRQARELQQKLHRDRLQKEKDLELQQERDRIKSSKELTEAKRKFDEQERKRAIDEQMRQKKKQQDELKEAHEALRREKEARFGKKEEAEKPPEERIRAALNAIKTLYPEYRNPGVAKTALNTLRVYTSNIVSNPEEAKFRSIKQDNKAFQERVSKVTGGLNYLKAVGFQDENGFYVYKSDNFDILHLGVRLIDEYLALIN